MTKRIVSVVIALLMAFICVIPAFATTITGDTVNDAAVTAASYAYMKKCTDEGVEPENYDSFTVTKTVKQTDANGETYYDVTLRSNYIYKYTCQVYGYNVSVGGISLVSRYSVDTDTAKLEETNYFLGLIGTLVDQVFTIFSDLIGALVKVEA